jgi:hypothetical protein
MTDMDDILAPIILWTLPLWLIPYAVWYFGRLGWHAAWDWVTEPSHDVV